MQAGKKAKARIPKFQLKNSPLVFNLPSSGNLEL